MRRLYLGVAIPKMTYTASVWYTPSFRIENVAHRSGNVGFTKALGRVQRVVALAITGAMKTTATDIAELHANLLPIDLILEKECQAVWLRIATLPQNHPIHKIVEYSQRRFIQRHRAPLYFLAQIFPIGFQHMEHIESTRRAPASKLTFGTYIAPTREESRMMHANNQATTQVYSDGSLKDGKVGAAAILLHNDRPGYRAIRYHLGSNNKYTNAKAEAVGAILGLHLLLSECRPVPTTLSIDSQSTIQGTDILHPRLGQYLIEHLICEGNKVSKYINRGGAKLNIIWASAHNGIVGNKLVDEHAKHAAEGDSSNPRSLPHIITDYERLPYSFSATRKTY